ncbi:MAG: ParB/RepB/Spo0J family partition protein [Proteobacteria bacterium]|nr:ParB/RepB/Spo0J family partition protein [Pseudomonadota bacterium]
MGSNKSGLKISGLMGIAGSQPEAKNAGFDLPALDLPFHGQADGGINIPSLIPLDLIVRSPFQNRFRVDEDEVELLAQDIRRDGLRNPATVRPLPDGHYELVSGQTRVEAFRVLARTEIPAFVRPMGDAEAARGAVLDNFFHRDLEDYEIYKGLKTLMDCGIASSLGQLASLTPWGKTHVFRFMSFGKLPQAAMDILAESAGLVSAKVAGEFAKLTIDGMPTELVTEALRLAVKGRLDPHKSAKWAESKWRKEAKAATPVPFGKRAVVLPSGRLVCTVSRTTKGLAVAGEKGAQVDWDALEADMAEWLSLRLAGEDADVTRPSSL